MMSHPPYFFAEMLRELKKQRAATRQSIPSAQKENSFQQRVVWTVGVIVAVPLAGLVGIGLLLQALRLG